MQDNTDQIAADYEGAGPTSPYATTVQTNWQNIKNHTGGFMGHFFDSVDSFMESFVPAFVAVGTAYAGGAALGGAFGSAGAAAGGIEGGTGLAGLGGAAGEAGLGSIGLEGAAGGLAGGVGEAGLGGLAAGIPSAGVVTIGAPAAAAGGGIGLGGIAAGVGGAAGLGSMLAPDGSPIQGPMQSVEVPRPPAEPSLGLPAGVGGSGAGGLLTAGDLGPIGVGALPFLDSVAQGPAPANGGVKPSLPGLGGGSNNSGTGGLGDLLNGLGSLYGAYNDTKNNAADTEFYKNQLDQMTGMYKPGTPEATLMEQKMNAQDAAAGRNSQYGTRAVNLAGALAQQRANIMTSAAYSHTADMYRNKGDQNANPWLNALGQATQGGGGLGSIFGALGQGYNYLNGLSGGGIGNSISSGLGSLFGNRPPQMGGVSGAVDNTLF